MNCLYLRKATLLLVLFLHVSGINAEDHAVKCPLLKVQRGTIHKVFINKTLRISCDLIYCDTFNKTFNVTWTKVNENKWNPVSEADQMSTSQIHSSSNPNMLTSYLTFTNILKHHEGHYRCELQLPHVSMHSHHIHVNVSVSDNILESEMTIERENTDSSSVSYPWWLPHLLISSGALIVILTVILILILCINACKNSRRKNTRRVPVQFTDLLKSDEYVCVQYSEETRYHDHTSS